MKFDPMTGKPVEEAVKRQPIGFDPHTGAPIYEEPVVQQTAPVQPAAPAQQTAQAQPVTPKFDPMTGQPIVAPVQPVAPAQPVTPKFDPMTGQPIAAPVQPVAPAQPAQQVTPQPLQQTGFDPITGQPVFGNASNPPVNPPKKKMKAGAKAGIIIGAVAVVCLAVAIPVFAILNSKEAKLARAIFNTFQDGGEISKALDDSKVLDQDEYTVTVDADASVDYESVDVNYTYIKSKKAKEMILSGNFDGDHMDATLLIDANTVTVTSSELYNQVLQYNYNQPVTGILASYTDAQTLETLNNILKNLYSGNQNTYQKDLKEALKNIHVTNGQKKSFLVDGKLRNCKGYTIVLDERSMMSFMSAYAGNSVTYSELSEAFEGMPTILLNFYVYKNMLSAVEVTVEGDTVTLELQGGDFRWQNMELKAAGMSIAKLTGSTVGGLETGALSIISFDGSGMTEIGSYSYDTRSGIFEIAADYSGFDMSVQLRITHAKGTFMVELVDMTYDGMSLSSVRGKLNAKITVQKGAVIQPISGNVININTFSASDLEGIEDIIDDVF